MLSKIKLENLKASQQDATEAMSDGNELAREVCQLITCKARVVDPHDLSGALVFHALDYAGIYGSRLVKFWDEVCEKDVILMIILLRAYQLGIAGVTKGRLNDLIDFSGYIDALNISRAVQMRFSGLRPVQ